MTQLSSSAQPSNTSPTADWKRREALRIHLALVLENHFESQLTAIARTERLWENDAQEILDALPFDAVVLNLVLDELENKLDELDIAVQEDETNYSYALREHLRTLVNNMRIGR